MYPYKENNVVIRDIDVFYKYIDLIYLTKSFSFITIINDKNIFTAELLGIYFYVHSYETIYLPLIEEQKNIFVNFNITTIINNLKKIFKHSKIDKIGHDIKLDSVILKKYDIDLRNKLYDIKLESYILNNVLCDHDIISMSNKYLDLKKFKYKSNSIEMRYFNSKYNNKKKYLHINNIPILLFKIHKKLWPIFDKSLLLKNRYYDIEIIILFILSKMENHGLVIDKDILINYSLKLDEKLKKIKNEINRITDEKFNLLSIKKLQKFLYDKEKLPVFKKTPKGYRSTNKKVLIKLSTLHLLPKLIIKYRNLKNIKSSYISKLLLMINPISNRIHSSYEQTATISGRIVSQTPNLQNIPIRKKYGKYIRKAFIAPPNYLIVSADYSQIELRVLAHYSQDIKFLDYFNSEQDIHKITASKIFNVSLSKVNKYQRQNAKIVNFGIIYGITPFGLSNQLDISYKEAKEIINSYFNRYPGVLNYITNIRNQVTKHGYVLTNEGKKIFFPNIYSNDLKCKKAIERSAIHAPIQSTSSEILKYALISIDQWLEEKKISAHLIMCIYDELIFEVRTNMIKVITQKIKHIMENCFSIDVPLKVNISIGKNWYDIRK